MNRQVSSKVLAEAFTRDEVRLARVHRVKPDLLPRRENPQSAPGSTLRRCELHRNHIPCSHLPGNYDG